MKPQIKNRSTDAVIYEGESGMTTRAVLERATATKVNLGGANLYGADLRGADLGGADLGGADLGGANLRNANLYGANLYGANLYGANLCGANLYGANLRNANLGEEVGKLITDRPFFQCGPIGSRGDYLLSFATDKGLVIKAGCFTGFIDEFVAAVEKTHGDTDHGKEYAMAILMIEAHAAIWSAK